ncbi:hypothetical protein HOY80DRAFT_894333, partial [Tuber brumale]
HDWLRKGGSFEANELQIKDHNTLPFKFKIYWSKSYNYFRLANDLARQVRVKDGQGIEQNVIEIYFLPDNTNFKSVDRLVLSTFNTLILLQITVAKSHNIKVHGIKNLYQSSPTTIKNIYTVFIIPEDCISEY